MVLLYKEKTFYYCLPLYNGVILQGNTFFDFLQGKSILLLAFS